jgi:hypothetical protein
MVFLISIYVLATKPITIAIATIKATISSESERYINEYLCANLKNRS